MRPADLTAYERGALRIAIRGALTDNTFPKVEREYLRAAYAKIAVADGMKPLCTSEVGDGDIQPFTSIGDIAARVAARAGAAMERASSGIDEEQDHLERVSAALADRSAALARPQPRQIGPGYRRVPRRAVG